MTPWSGYPDSKGHDYSGCCIRTSENTPFPDVGRITARERAKIATQCTEEAAGPVVAEPAPLYLDRQSGSALMSPESYVSLVGFEPSAFIL